MKKDILHIKIRDDFPADKIEEFGRQVAAVIPEDEYMTIITRASDMEIECISGDTAILTMDGETLTAKTLQKILEDRKPKRYLKDEEILWNKNSK